MKDWFAVIVAVTAPEAVDASIAVNLAQVVVSVVLTVTLPAPEALIVVTLSTSPAVVAVCSKVTA